MLLLQPSSSCDICMEEYCSDISDRSPHSISCGHIFCGLCLRTLNQKQCPMCRASFRRITRLRADVEIQRVSIAAGSSSASPTAPRSHHTRCNICSSSIYGDRYKCSECPDYNTCAACFDLTLENHPGHSFIIIHDPSDRIKRSQRAVEHNVNCGNCKKRVYGVRYQCTVCPDYDLCASCESPPIPIHSAAHPMVKIKSPNSAAYAQPLRAKVPGPIINRVVDMDSTSGLLSQPLQANEGLRRPLEDTIILSQLVQVNPRRTRQEQPLPRAQMNAQSPLRPPHETGLWELQLERQSPYTYTVCRRGPVDSETRLRNSFEEHPRLIILKGRSKFTAR